MWTRRKWLAAVAVGAGAGIALDAAPVDRGDVFDSSQGRLNETEVETLVGVAEVVYPSAVTATPEFVSGYAKGLDDSRSAQLAATLQELNDYARSTYRADFAAVSPEERDVLLREIGVDAAYPAPEGTFPARVRYHVVNGLLYALFTVPEGSRLVGIDNPAGFPGGFYGSAEHSGDG